MQLSKLTFSLASLVLIFALAFVTMPAMAATGGPTVTITDAGTADTPSTRSAFKLKFVWDVTVTGFEAADVTASFYNKSNRRTTAVTVGALTETTGKEGKEFTVDVDLSSAAATDVGFSVTVAADVAIGDLVGNPKDGIGNVARTVSFTLPPLHIGKVVINAMKDAADTDASDGQDYNLTFTFKAQSGAPTPALTADLVEVTPSYITAPVTFGSDAQGTGDAAADYIYSASITHPAGAPTLTIGLEPSYVAASNVTTAMVPPPPPIEQDPPSVRMQVSGHDPDSREFRLEVTFTPGLKSNGDPGDPVTVGKWAETSGKDFLPSEHLKFTDATNAVTAPVINLTTPIDRASDNNYLAIFTYTRLDVLPITITTKDAFETSDDPRTSVVLRAGPGTPQPSGITLNPSQFPNQTFVAGTPITPVFLPMATGGTPPYTYTLAPLPTGLVFTAATQELSGTPTVAGTATPTYTVRDTGSRTATLTFTIEVLSADTPSVIPDTSLAAAIRRSLNLAANTPLTAAVMADLTDLNAYNSGVARLDGLQQATNLTTLDLGMNRITNISVLSGMSQLTHLYLDDNQITNVSALSGLRNLRLLRLAGNSIEDTSPLATLIAQNPGLDLDIPPISPADDSVTFADENLKRAVRIALRMTENETITEEAMRNLFFLEAYDRRIESIQGLEHATNMIALDLGKNAIVDVSPLSGLTQLQILFLDDNQISDVSPLASLTQLDLLFLTGNPISSLAPIEALIGGIQIFRSKAEQ